MSENLKSMGSIRYNKDMWTLITGAFVNSAEDAVAYELDKAEKQLFLGINVFLPTDINKATDKRFKDTETKDMYQFLDTLVKLLGVDMDVAYDLLCYYVLYEFRGSSNGMQSMISTERHTKILVQDIWLFYQSERMFLLKCVNFLWTYYCDCDHRFHELYTEILRRHSEADTFQAFAKQIISVIKEVMPTAATHGECMTDRLQSVWFVSNMREQIQTIHNMIIYLEFYNCTAEEFQQLFTICKEHYFGHSANPPLSLHSEYMYYREIIGQMECVLLLTALNLNTTCVEGSKLFARPKIFREMAKEMDILGSMEVHGPLIIAWMGLMLHPDQSFFEPPPDFFERYGNCVIKLKVFPYLTKLLKSTTIQNTSKLRTMAFECVEKLLSMLLDIFAVKSLVKMNGLYELTAMLLTNSMVACHVLNSDRASGIWLIIDEAKRIFTKQFIPLAGIVESIASCGPEFIEAIAYYLENLSTPEDPSVSSIFEETVDSVNGSVLESSRFLAGGNLDADFVARNYGLGQPSSEVDAKSNIELNFCVVLTEQLSNLLAEISRGASYVTEDCYDRALGGIKCLHQLVENQCSITSELSQASAIVFNLIEKFSMGTQCYNELLASCLDVASSLLLTRPEVVCRRLSSIKFLPTVDVSECADPVVIARGDFFYMHTVGYILAKHECTTGKYPLLIAYLRFVNRVLEPSAGGTLMKTLENCVEIILPCLVFVTTNVFPHFDTWMYDDPESDIAIIGHYCLRLLHVILSPDSSSELADVIKTLKGVPQLKGGVKKMAPYLLHHTALYSLLHTNASVGLIKVIALGDRFLQELMLRQPDWMEGNGVLFTNNVLLAMSILNRVILYKNTFSNKSGLSKIELLLLGVPPAKERCEFYLVYNKNRSTDTHSYEVTMKRREKAHPFATDAVRMVNVIANYIFHSFNPKLPIMSVRLIKRLASEFSISLLCCLTPDCDQICQQFLCRLNSRRESSDLKVAILELMTAAIPRQFGLSERFLNLESSNDQEYRAVDYIIATLDQLRKTPETVPVAIHQNVISLVQAIWTLYSQSVLDHFRSRETFWDGVCAPFFLLPLSKEVSMYHKIIEICTLEMRWYGSEMSPSLARNLQLLFDSEEPLFERWSEFVGNTFASKKNEGVSVADVEELAISWKDLLTKLIKYSPFPLKVAQKKMIVSGTMKIMLTELESGDNQIVIRQIADTMAILLNNWKKDFEEDQSVVTTAHLLTLMDSLTSSYGSLEPDSKQSLLAFTIRLIFLLTEQISNDDHLSSSVMQAAATLASTEITLILNSPPPAVSGLEVYLSLPVTLSVSLLQKMIHTIGNTSFWHASFHETKLIHQLMDAAQLALGKPTLFSLALVSLDTLLLLSYTDLSKTMVVFKVGIMLWVPLIPPIMTMKQGLPWFMGKWCQIYERGLRLVTHLLIVHGLNFVAEAISFVAIHEPYITAILIGMRSCVKPELLRLVITTLHFLMTLQQYSAWKNEHPSSFYNINRCVVFTLDQSVAFLLEPHVLSVAVQCTTPFSRTKYGPNPPWATYLGEATDCSITPEFTTATHNLLECIIACLSVLYPLSPTFLSIMTDILDTEVPIAPLVEAHYRIPTVAEDPQGRLTLGTLASLINLCTWAIREKGPDASVGYSPRKAKEHLKNLPTKQLILALEMSLSFMLAQTLVAAANTNLPQFDRKRIMLTFVNKMTPTVDNIKQYVLGEEVERQQTPSVEQTGSSLKRQSNGGRSQCSRRLQFTSSPCLPKNDVIDVDVDPLPTDPSGKKCLDLNFTPKSQRLEKATGKHTVREYIELMMILYKSSFHSACRDIL